MVSLTFAAAINPNLLTALKVIHIVSASYFGLGALLATIFALQVPYTPTIVAKARVMGWGSRTALTMIVPGVLIAGASGIAVTYYEGLSLHTRWVLVSVICYALAFVLGIVSGPLNARMRRLAEAEAHSGKRPSVELLEALAQPTPRILTAATLLLTVILVFLMFAQGRAPFMS